MLNKTKCTTFIAVLIAIATVNVFAIEVEKVYMASDIAGWSAMDFDGQQVVVSPVITTDADEMNLHRLTIDYSGSGKVLASVIHSKMSSLGKTMQKSYLRGKLRELPKKVKKSFNSYYSLEKYAWIALRIEGDVKIKSLTHSCFHGKNTIYGHIPLTYEFDGNTLPYRLLLPKDYNPKEDKKYPLVLSLGGSSSLGTDNKRNMEMVILGMYLFAKYYDDPEFACFSLVPQIPQPRDIKPPYYPAGPKGAPTQYHQSHYNVNAQGWYTQATLSLIKTLLNDPRLNIDPDRIYLTGFSLGGKGVWEFMKADPDMFAATICGAGWPIGMPYRKLNMLEKQALKEEVKIYKHIPTAIYAGEKDAMRYGSQAVYDLLKLEGADCKLEIIKGASHVSSAAKTWAIKSNVQWLFTKRKKSDPQ